ncbi:PqqD family peptide modification chaperone [Lachnospira multipara]|uniref:PqqD family peptide modification chaperone n=1 Tax=Lachnospira multipara TaxID=28051 RepID=UPI0004213161|nr:PqqD family peptide modification chaperone [Lachnospira multipara]
MLYKVKNNNVIIKEETSNCYRFVVDKGVYKFGLNKTGKQIYDRLNEHSSVESITNSICELYPKVDKNIVKRDVYSMMKCFELYGIISMEQSEYELKDDVAIFNGDKFYKLVSSFIQSRLKISSINFCIDNNMYYDSVMLRMREMQGEEYQLFVQKNNEIVAFAAFECKPIGITKVVKIKDMIFDEKLGIENAIKSYQLMERKILNMFSEKVKISKVRILNNKDKFIDENAVFLEKIGFKKIVELDDENIMGAVCIYDKHI